jgi:hypothetical protein
MTPIIFKIIKKFYRKQIKKVNRAQSLIKLNAERWNWKTNMSLKNK